MMVPHTALIHAFLLGVSLMGFVICMAIPTPMGVVFNIGSIAVNGFAVARFLARSA